MSTPVEPRWEIEPLPLLIEHILARFHAPLREDLPRIEAMAERVAPEDPNGPRILAVVRALRNDLEPHMLKEEEILFPWIREGGGASIEGPIDVMRLEHDEVDALLSDLRDVAGNYVVPPGASVARTSLLRSLSRLEMDLRAHMQIENDVLFPRALGE